MQSADFSSDDLIAFLNLAWANCTNAANSLGAQLLVEQQNRLALFAPAGSISHVSKNSVSQAAAAYGPGGLSPRQITQIFSKLSRDYSSLLSQCQTDSLAAGCNPTVVATFDFDEIIFNGMVADYNFQSEIHGKTRPSIVNLPFSGAGRVPEGVWSW